MVHVYLAEIPGGRSDSKEQSKWAHRLLDMALEREYPDICGPVSLERDFRGKPFLSEYPNICINLSHSGAYAACAIGERPVGVDVECKKARRRQELVVKKFHPKEQEAYRAVSEEEQALLFRELWALKESFMKAEGSGLGMPLASFYMEGIVAETGRVVQGRNNKDYYYRLYRQENWEFSLAVCSEDPAFWEEPVWLELCN